MNPTIFLYKSLDEKQRRICFFIQRVATGSGPAKVPPGISLLPGGTLSDEQFDLLRQSGWNIHVMK
ncbi:MAG TPA: hypothetical protein VGP72_19290 [Planctomycetota bacterium]